MTEFRLLNAAVVGALIGMCLAGCAGSPGPSAGDNGVGYASAAEIEADPDRMVCRREKETGSRLVSRVCKTAREWEQERVDNQDAMRNATKSPQPPSNLPNAGGG